MNFKELIVPLFMAFAVTWAIQYFFFNKKETVEGIRTMQPFVAPTGIQEARPLNTEIDFIDIKRTAPVDIVEVQTDGANLFFSTNGASLDRLEFKRKADNYAYTIDTIFPVNESERENRCFLVAYDQKTPYYFRLMERVDLPDSTTLTYQADTDEVMLTKLFTIYKHTYQIDLELKVAPKTDNAGFGNLRLLYPSPLMPELSLAKGNYREASGSSDIISAIIAGDQGVVQKIARANVNVNQGWFAPSLFGTESRYFVHAMVKDPQAFCQRAYAIRADAYQI